MELVENIRLKIGEFILAKKLANSRRKVYYSNLSVVKNIGIVWDASNLNEFQSLSRFYQTMQEKNINVKILGYFPGKDLPDQYTAIRFLTCIKKSELNFLLLPVSPESGSFINNHFDILIDVNFRNLFPLQYISSLSNARFKVGLFEPENGASPFDLMMEIKKPVDIDNYLNETIQYLGMIKSGTPKTVNT